ncbi:hypothetical protein LTR09_010881 [Extremus antarcticus]|uniref:Uncharacterized protein n=1 Tax=Extremus antarcticus TaxID=702011 RepID=A0AAJ0DCV3_9PEZI|nr:hypothetical protein LTR09_010881 [Extremus antarcticus]
MARLSKASTFAIFYDTGIPTPDSETPPPLDRTRETQTPPTSCADNGDGDQSTGGHGSIAAPISEDLEYDDADDERRESTYTSTSISSVSESYKTDVDDAVFTLTHQPYTPPIIRPSFRRPESVRRMQMSSPRQSLLHKPRSRAGTPRSARSATAKGSPRSRRWGLREEGSEDEAQQQEAQLPLVLLHVTLLPVDLPWSVESMQGLLPQKTLENLQLLQSKVTEVMLQRGVLIPHPREEYELLEERLLEALELKQERVTKCGHFLSRASESSPTSLANAEQDSDSGIGSSIDGSDGELCETCHGHVKTVDTAVGTKNKKWRMRVYAANGLMQASAWTAAWSEMERVDVEILPWLDEEVRRKLEDRRRQEMAEARQRDADEERRIREMVDERVALACEQIRRDNEERPWRNKARTREAYQRDVQHDDGTSDFAAPAASAEQPRTAAMHDLPQIYRPSQVPISILIKNYVYLLAQDKRNVVVCCLVVVLAWLLAVGTGTKAGTSALSTLNEPCTQCQALNASSGVPSMAVEWEQVGEDASHVEMVQDLADEAVILAEESEVR